MNRKKRNEKKMILRRKVQAACTNALEISKCGIEHDKRLLRLMLLRLMLPNPDWLKVHPYGKIEAVIKKHFPNLTGTEAAELMQTELLRQTLRQDKSSMHARLWHKYDHWRHVLEAKRELIRYYDGDIIITDPCYLFAHDEQSRELWRKSEYGENLPAVGVPSGIGRNTIYGDWSCTVVETIKRRPVRLLGEFCADSGQVAVMLLSDALKLRPDFDDHVTKPWACCLIKNFKGSVQIKYVRKAQEIRVLGVGNKRFYSTQTGL